jgi:uncharacterized protein YhbP (UPF0306 family)
VIGVLERIQGTEMKKTEERRDLVAALLGEQTTLSLATTGADGEPWVAPLFYLVDKDLALYWLSSASSLHSLNLERTPRAAATVYANAENWKEIRGVQMRGLVSKVTEPKRRRALIKAYGERFKLGAAFRLAIRQSVLYEFRPEFLRYIDNSRGFGYKLELRRGPEGFVDG